MLDCTQSFCVIDFAVQANSQGSVARFILSKDQEA